MDGAIRRLLIYRVGSIGDFIVALPCLRLIRRVYPDAEIGLLANEPVDRRAAAAHQILDGSGLIDCFFSYPAGTRDPRILRGLRQTVRDFAPDLLVYLISTNRIPAVYRDYLFFRSCGIHQFIGVPWRLTAWRSRSPMPGSALWEREAERLARAVSQLGNIDFTCPKNWQLGLSATEIATARDIISAAIPAGAAGEGRILAMSIGTKQPINDWGDANWRDVMAALKMLDYHLVLIGGAEDRERSQRLADTWNGSALNLCGELTPRMSAGVLSQAAVLLCHDSGPMHLAAAVGTRCVAVFSQRNRPGKWFPLGPGHTILYPCAPGASIQSIPPRQVIAASVAALSRDDAVSTLQSRQPRVTVH